MTIDPTRPNKLHLTEILANLDSSTLTHPDWQSLVEIAATAPDTVDLFSAPLLDANLSAEIKPLIESTNTNADNTIAMLTRRSLPVFSTQLEASKPAATAGLAINRTLGPFRDQFGNPVWFDLFRTTRFIRFTESTAAPPYLALPLQVSTLISSTPQQQWEVPSGSVWIASQLLAAAPPNAYTGLLVSSGTLVFDSPVAISTLNDEVILSRTASFTLTLNLVQASTPAGSGAGVDARTAQIQLPDRVVFRFDATGVQPIEVADARAIVYGSVVNLKAAALPFTSEYLADANRLAIPMIADRADFEAANVQSTLVQLAGTAPLVRVAWGLPVALIEPTKLGEASGDTVLLLWLDRGWSLSWRDQARSIDLGPARLSADPSRLSIVAASTLTANLQQSLEIAANKSSERLQLSWNTRSPISYISQASGAEVLTLQADLSLTLTSPVDLAGEPFPIRVTSAQIFLIQSGEGERLFMQGAVQPMPRKTVGLGLINGVLVANYPDMVALQATCNQNRCESGIAVLRFPLRDLIPTLPDPYASNIQRSRGGFRQPSGVFALSLLQWQPSDRTFDVIVPQVVLPQQGSNQAIVSATPDPDALMAGSTTAYLKNSEQLQDAIKQSGDAFDFERSQSLILLDVSSNAGQFGVAIGYGVVRGQQQVQTTVREMQVQLTGPGLSLVALPAVQWEAVWTESDPDPSFPSRLSFTTNGVPTVFSVPTVNLVPVQPISAITRILNNFADANPNPVGARFTLPFGIVARALLDRPNSKVKRGANVSSNRPRQGELEGAFQLRVDARDAALPADASPSLPGFAVQLPIGLPGGRSAIGDSATSIFNSYLGAFGRRPLVPVSRIDISGYGESLFSDWRNPYNDPEVDAVAVTQARFDVVIGRTSVEIIQVRSKLWCYGVDVVRTVTIERKNSGAVTRRDSGWQAVSEGVYDFGGTITTHPGVVHRITQVTNIRETGQILTVDGIDLAAVRFDGSLHLEGAEPVPVRDHLGYVQITAGGLMGATTYAKLIEQAGSLGGEVDATIAIGSGQQQMRLNRVGVGVAAGMGEPEFAMAAWGAPIFPSGGQWSFLQINDPSAAPIEVDRTRGVPMIRAGAATIEPSPASPYRFADPEDLLRPTNPASDYAILHATTTQRTLFPRPKIEAFDPARITSTQIPLLADPFILATSQGSFPQLTACIPFPSNAWALLAQPEGHYRLELPSSTFPAGVGRRTINQAGSVKGDLDYTRATITYEVDTAASPAWRFALDGVDKIMNSTDLGDVITLRADVHGSSERATQIESPQMLIGSGMEVVQDILTLLQDLGISGTTEVEMTNKWSMKIAMKVPIKDVRGEDLTIPPSPLPPGVNPDIKFTDTGISISQTVVLSHDEAEFEFGGSPMFAIKSVPGLYVVAILKFAIKLSTKDGTSYKLLIGFGIAYELKATSWLKLKGLFALTIFGVVGDTVLGFGAGFLLKVSADLKIVAITVRLEGKLALVWACRGTPNESQWSVAKLVFGVDITIAFIFSISFEYEGKTKSLMQGAGEPSCSLPDVI